jgi:NTE family protein
VRFLRTFCAETSRTGRIAAAGSQRPDRSGRVGSGSSWQNVGEMRNATELTTMLPGPIGFVFGGGGSLGAAQVGMLQAVAERGVEAGLVTGTSIGAINGAVVAADPFGAASRLSHIWNEIETKSLLPGGLVTRLWTLWRRKVYLYETMAIDEFLARELGDIDIADLEIPFGAIALDVDLGTSTTLTSGRLRTAVRASSAIPGVFPPVTHEGRDYYDGGIVENVPVMEALDLGAKSLVVFDCAFADRQIDRPKNATEALFYSMTLQMRAQAQRDMPLAAQRVPVLYLPGPAPMRVNPLDFSRTPALIRGGYTATRRFLDTVAIDGPGLYRSAVDPARAPVVATPALTQPSSDA